MPDAVSNYWQSPAKITRSLAGCATLTGLAGGQVIRMHHSSDSKLGSYFAHGLEHAGLSRAAPILSADADDDAGLLKVTVALPSVADWKLRSQVHQVAMRVEDEHDVTVLCYFRPLDPVPFAAKHARPARPNLPELAQRLSGEQIGPSTHRTATTSRDCTP